MNVDRALAPMEQFVRQLVGWAPRLLLLAVVVVAGLVLTSLAARGVRWLVRRSGLEALTEKFGVAKLLYAVGVRHGFAHILGVATWIAGLLVTVSAAAETVGLPGMAEVTASILAALPRVLLAAVIAAFGFVIADVLRNVVMRAASRGKDLESPVFAARLAYWAVLVLSIAIALEQAGVETGLINAVVQITVAGAALSIGLAFALGSRPAFQNLLARFYYERMLRPGDRIRIGDVEGTVTRYGAVAVVIETDEGGERVIPCSRLMDEVVDLSRGETDRPAGDSS